MQAVHTIGGRLAAALGLAALALLTLLLGACGSAASVAPDGPAATGANSETAAAVAGRASIKMDIADRASNLTREDLRVQQGDTVSISFTADEAGEIHLHGYNLTAPVAPGAPGRLDFEAATAGAFGINFHIYAAGDGAATGDDGGGMHHGDDAIALSAPAAVAVSATPDGSGGLNVAIDAEGWRWAPERVNEAHRPGEGHGHIYVDGVKVNRVYGPNYHLAGLAPGERRIRVTLNANSHNGLTVDGQALEAAMVVTVPESVPESDGGGQRAAPAAVEAPAAMRVSAAAHPDPLGGYNLEAQVEGFAFAPPGPQDDGGGGPVSGAAGYGLVAIDGAPHGRLYGAWQKLPALAPGTHTIVVTLHDGDGAPYQWDGRPVAASVTVEVPEMDGDGGHSGGHHGYHGAGGNGGHSHGGGSDTAAAAESGDDGGGRAVVAEVHLGNLEVYP